MYSSNLGKKLFLKCSIPLKSRNQEVDSRRQPHQIVFYDGLNAHDAEHAPVRVELAEVWWSLVLLVRRERPLISMFLEEGQLTEIDTKTGRAVLAFQADRQRVIESFQQAENRYFLQHCLQEVLKRRLKVEVAAVESLIPELVPAVALEV